MRFAGIAQLVILVLTSSLAADDFGVVHVYRDATTMGSAITPTIFVDGEPLVDIGAGLHYAGQFAPGKRVFHVDDKRSGVEIDVRPGQSYFLRVEIIPGFWKGHGRMTMVLPEQGRYESRELKIVARSAVSNRRVPFGYEASTMAAMVRSDLTTIAERLMMGRRYPEKIGGMLAREIGNPEMLDPWGTTYLYRTTDGGSGFVLVSAGADRVFDEAAWVNVGVFEDISEDFVIVGKGRSVDITRRWQTDGK